MRRVSRAVGVLGGAFNPPHVGHLVLAQEAISALGLDELMLVPTGRAPHKRIEPEPGPEVRLAMAEAAVAGVERRPGLATSRSSARARPTPTVRLSCLRMRYQGVNSPS